MIFWCWYGGLGSNGGHWVLNSGLCGLGMYEFWQNLWLFLGGGLEMTVDGLEKVEFLLLLDADDLGVVDCLLCASGVGRSGDFVGSGRICLGCLIMVSSDGLGRLRIVG